MRLTDSPVCANAFASPAWPRAWEATCYAPHRDDDGQGVTSLWHTWPDALKWSLDHLRRERHES